MAPIDHAGARPHCSHSSCSHRPQACPSPTSCSYNRWSVKNGNYYNVIHACATVQLLNETTSIHCGFKIALEYAPSPIHGAETGLRIAVVSLLIMSAQRVRACRDNNPFGQLKQGSRKRV